MPNSEDSGKHLPSIADYQWGEANNELQIGLWVSASSIEIGGFVDARAAVRNLSNHRIRVGNAFGLTIEVNGKIFEDFGGPRSSSTTWFKPGEFREVVGWRISEQINQQADIYRCRAIYRRTKGGDLRSAVISIETKASSR